MFSLCFLFALRPMFQLSIKSRLFLWAAIVGHFREASKVPVDMRAISFSFFVERQKKKNKSPPLTHPENVRFAAAITGISLTIKLRLKAKSL